MPTGPRIRANNVYGILSETLGIASTTMNSSGLSVLPAVTLAHAVIVIDPKRMFGEPEIVVVTDHLAGNISATIVRGQYGTNARTHAINTPWAHIAIDEDYTKVVTSTTRPTNPYVGQMVFETDTTSFKFWTGSVWSAMGTGGGSTGATIYQNPAAPVTPAPVTDDLWIDTDESSGVGLSSILAYTEIAADPVASATAGNTVDIPGLAVTVTVPEGRRLRITAKFIGYANTLPARLASTIKEGGTTLGNFEAQPTAAGMGLGLHAEVIISPSAGTHTYKAAITAATNTGFVYVDATLKAWILVEDITGTLWPAGQSIGVGTIASEAWTEWLPVITQGVAVTNSKLKARYTKVGRMVTADFVATITSTGTAGAMLTLTPPVPAVAGQYFPVGVASFYSSGTKYLLIAETQPSGIIRFQYATGTTDAVFGVNAPFTGAVINGQILAGTITYEATS